MDSEYELIENIKQKILYIERKLERHDFDKREVDLRDIEKRIDYLDSENYDVKDLRIRFNELVNDISKL